MHRTVFDQAGRPVEYGVHVYRTDLYSMGMTLAEKWAKRRVGERVLGREALA